MKLQSEQYFLIKILYLLFTWRENQIFFSIKYRPKPVTWPLLEYEESIMCFLSSKEMLPDCYPWVNSQDFQLSGTLYWKQSPSMLHNSFTPLPSMQNTGDLDPHMSVTYIITISEMGQQTALLRNSPVDVYSFFDSILRKWVRG